MQKLVEAGSGGGGEVKGGQAPARTEELLRRSRELVQGLVEGER